jgi:hypothetical protein
LLVGSPLVGSPLVGSPLVGSPLVGSPLVRLSARWLVSRDLVSRDLVSRDLVSRDLVSRDLVSRDLVSRDLVSRDLVSRCSQLVGQLGGIYGASQNRWGPYVSGHFAHFPRFMLQCTKSTGTRAGDGSKDPINAGYSTGSAHQRAYELTNPNICPHVVKQIKIYRDELDHKYGIDYKRHIRDLQVIRDRALENGAYSAAVQAEYRRGQAHGDIYINKSEIRHGSIDSMSKEDVLKALNEIKDGYAQNTIDVTPEREADSGDIPEQGERVVEDDEVSLGEEPEEV